MTHVIIPDYPTRLQFTIGATPSTGPFAFNFTFFATSDIDVYIDARLGVEHVDYDVTGNPGREGGFEGGSVLLTGTLQNTLITILRNLPIERVSDFPVAGSFNRQTLNGTLDKHVAMIQQVDERVDRAIMVPPTDSGFPTLPGAAVRAGKVLSFDPSGNPIAQIPGWPATLTANYFPHVNPAGTTYELIAPGAVLAGIGGQPLDATLTALAGLASAANQTIYSTGPDSFALTALTAYARSILDDLDAVAARATLGLGSLALQNANAVAITGGTITGMPNPTSASDVASKQYVDSVAAGITKRSTVRVATVANVLLASGLVNGATIDGRVLATGDAVLVRAQTLAAENGVYAVTASGAASRTAEYDTWNEHPGALVVVQEGTVNADSLWYCTADQGGTLGTTPIGWSQVTPGIAVPVIIANGGTGQTTAPGAFDAIKQPATETYAGVQLLTGRSYRNILRRNGGLELWQRGAGGAASFTLPDYGQYTADGWYLYNGASQATVVSQQPGLTDGSRYCMRIQRTAGNAVVTAAYLEFPLDTDEIAAMRNSIVTLSFVARAGANFSPAGGTLNYAVKVGTGTPVKNVLSGYTAQSITLTGNTPVTAVAARYSLTSSIAVLANATQACVQFSWTPAGTAGAADYFEIDDVQVEVGAVANPFERRPFESELLACQRHYEKTFAYQTAPASGVGFNNAITSQQSQASAAGITAYWRYGVAKRVAPSVAPFNPGAANTLMRNYNNTTDYAFNYMTGADTKGVGMITSVAVTAGDACLIHLAADAGI